MEVRYDNMEYLLECCEKLNHIESMISVLSPHLTFQLPRWHQRAMDFVVINSEYYFEIDIILAHNDTIGLDFFLVQWKGVKHPPTWELLEDLIEHGSSALTEYLLSECASIAASIGLSRIANGISESTYCQEQRLGRSKTLERNLRLFLKSGKLGTR